MRLPNTWLLTDELASVDWMLAPAKVLPEMRLRAAGVLPPMRLLDAPTPTMTPEELAAAWVPEASVPRKLPSTLLEVEVEPSISMPNPPKWFITRPLITTLEASTISPGVPGPALVPSSS